MHSFNIDDRYRKLVHYCSEREKCFGLLITCFELFSKICKLEMKLVFGIQNPIFEILANIEEFFILDHDGDGSYEITYISTFLSLIK